MYFWFIVSKKTLLFLNLVWSIERTVNYFDRGSSAVSAMSFGFASHPCSQIHASAATAFIIWKFPCRVPRPKLRPCKWQLTLLRSWICENDFVCHSEKDRFVNSKFENLFLWFRHSFVVPEFVKIKIAQNVREFVNSLTQWGFRNFHTNLRFGVLIKARTIRQNIKKHRSKLFSS